MLREVLRSYPERGMPNRAHASGNLEQAGRAHATANAHGHDHVLAAPPLSFDEDMTGHACAAHAVGMADGNRTSVHIELFRAYAEFARGNREPGPRRLHSVR